MVKPLVRAVIYALAEMREGLIARQRLMYFRNGIYLR